jgi:hypothetical protein
MSGGSLERRDQIDGRGLTHTSFGSRLIAGTTRPASTRRMQAWHGKTCGFSCRPSTLPRGRVEIRSGKVRVIFNQ